MKDIKLSKDMIYKVNSEKDKCTGCKLCMKNCPMLDNYCSTPKELLNNMAEGEKANIEIPYSCALCGYCTEVCPKGVDLKALFYDMRKFIVSENEGVPREVGSRVVAFHQKNSFSNLFTTKIQGLGHKKPDKVFFPGCSLTSYSPKLVLKVYEFLCSKHADMGILLKCCGKPTHSMGDLKNFNNYYSKVQSNLDNGEVKEVITSCQNCYKIIGQYSPNVKVTSLWEFIAEHGIPEAMENRAKDIGISFALHDPCPTRSESKIHDSVREILVRLGVQIEEMEFSRNKTLCCGSGGMLAVTNNELALKHMKKRAEQAKSSHVITYCEECVQSLKRGGKQAAHILDLIFDEELYEKDNFNQSSQGTMKSWINRYNGARMINKINNGEKI